MSKKLFLVRVEFDYYAEADSARDACLMATDALHNEDLDIVADAEAVDRRHVPSFGDGSRLIYGAKRDTTLDEALESRGLPTSACMRDARRKGVAP